MHGQKITMQTGDLDEPFAVASLTKLMTAMAVLVAHEEGTVDLDEPLSDQGATVADLLAHAGGIGPENRRAFLAPHRRRIYSTPAYDMVAELVAERADMPFADYLGAAVLEPLEMENTTLDGSPGSAAWSTVNDLLRLSAAWRNPVLVHATTLERATQPHLPELDGVLPGFGGQSPNPWGLGPEIRGEKSPHWTAPDNDPSTFGHFGQTGTMMWIDPTADVVAVSLADRVFGPWAASIWPAFSAAALRHAVG